MCTHVCIYVCLHVGVYMYVYIGICVCKRVFVCVCVCVWARACVPDIDIKYIPQLLSTLCTEAQCLAEPGTGVSSQLPHPGDFG